MTPVQSLIEFAAAATVITVLPGLDTALVLRTVTAEGARSAAAASAGILLGCLAWGVAAAFGAGAVLASSGLAFDALRWAGAAYLAWLGVGLLTAGARAAETKPGVLSRDRGAWTWFRRGLVTNLLNPKVGVFYVSLLPQFVPREVEARQWMVMLATVHALLGGCWFALLVGAGTQMARHLRDHRRLRLLDRVAGTLFLCFAVRLALTRR